MSTGGGPPAREWYADGLRFECTSCGRCCTGPPGVVRFTDEEGRAIAGRLGVTHAEFIERYTHDPAGAPSLREVETEHGHDCVFLDRETEPGRAVCSIYDVRPAQCRTFPFWPEHLRSSSAWRRVGRACEGVGRGPLVPIERIRVLRDGRRPPSAHSGADARSPSARAR